MNWENIYSIFGMQTFQIFLLDFFYLSIYVKFRNPYNQVYISVKLCQRNTNIDVKLTRQLVDFATACVCMYISLYFLIKCLCVLYIYIYIFESFYFVILWRRPWTLESNKYPLRNLIWVMRVRPSLFTKVKT